MIGNGRKVSLYKGEGLIYYVVKKKATLKNQDGL